jgi:hypothetical protein
MFQVLHRPITGKVPNPPEGKSQAIQGFDFDNSALVPIDLEFQLVGEVMVDRCDDPLPCPFAFD